MMLFVLFLWAGPIFGDERDARISTLVVPGKYEASILELRPPADVAESLQKFETAIRGNQAWFQQYVKENMVPGKPLPYHEKFGISKTAYERINAAKSETQLVPVENCEVTIVEKPNGRFQFTGTGRASCLDGLEVDRSQRALQYKKLVANDCRLVDPKKGAIAPITGVTWKSDESKPESKNSKLYVSIGRLGGSKDQIFLNFIAQTSQNGKQEFAHDIAIQFSIK